MLATQNNNSARSAMANGTEQGEEKGTTRDIVAKKAGISSGTTYKRAKFAVKEIDRLKEEGKEKDAQFLYYFYFKIALSHKSDLNYFHFKKAPSRECFFICLLFHPVCIQECLRQSS